MCFYTQRKVKSPAELMQLDEKEQRLKVSILTSTEAILAKSIGSQSQSQGAQLVKLIQLITTQNKKTLLKLAHNSSEVKQVLMAPELLVFWQNLWRRITDSQYSNLCPGAQLNENNEFVGNLAQDTHPLDVVLGDYFYREAMHIQQNTGLEHDYVPYLLMASYYQNVLARVMLNRIVYKQISEGKVVLSQNLDACHQRALYVVESISPKLGYFMLADYYYFSARLALRSGCKQQATTSFGNAYLALYKVREVKQSQVTSAVNYHNFTSAGDAMAALKTSCVSLDIPLTEALTARHKAHHPTA